MANPTINGCTRCCENAERADAATANKHLAMARFGANDTFFNPIATSGVSIRSVKPMGGPETSFSK